MHGRILVPTDLSPESNSVFPWACTIAQAFPNKLYLLNVMDPDSVNKPERLEDFPQLNKFFAKDALDPGLNLKAKLRNVFLAGD